MRPRLLDVTLTEMTLLFPGRPPMAATVRLRAHAVTIEDALAEAIRELAAMTPRQLELVREIAKPVPAAALTHAVGANTINIPIDPATGLLPLEGVIRRVYQEPRYAGSVHCPGCGGTLGKGNSPSIGYVRHCHHCRGVLDIQFHEGGMVVVYTPG